MRQHVDDVLAVLVKGICECHRAISSEDQAVVDLHGYANGHWMLALKLLTTLIMRGRFCKERIIAVLCIYAALAQVDGGETGLVSGFRGFAFPGAAAAASCFRFSAATAASSALLASAWS